VGIRAAFAAYGPSQLQHPKCVVFLVQDDERNIFDQRHLEHHVQEGGAAADGREDTPPIPVFRVPFSQVLEHTALADSPARQLLLRPPANPAAVHEVAVVYLRCGYDPGDYPDDTAWAARYHVERSGAIKCPTVLTQLAGAKKVQQVLATPAVYAAADTNGTSHPSALARFVPTRSDAATLVATFTNIYPLDTSPAGLEARRLALDPALCTGYVLKPQREGGGNNTYRGAIPGRLRALPEAHWPAHVLMELIEPPAETRNVILRHGALERGGVVCELGVYGTCLWGGGDGDKSGGRGPLLLHNAQAGWLLRTKGDQSEEGGVAAGFGCMDSVALV
jgi:glutathione synthase